MHSFPFHVSIPFAWLCICRMGISRLNGVWSVVFDDFFREMATCKNNFTVFQRSNKVGMNSWSHQITTSNIWRISALKVCLRKKLKSTTNYFEYTWHPSNIWGRRLENQWLHKFNPTLTELYTDKQSPKIQDNGVKLKFWPLSISELEIPFISWFISRSAHRTPNFTNPKYFVCLLFEYFFQIKVLNWYQNTSINANITR